jgi:hypothetical protein
MLKRIEVDRLLLPKYDRLRDLKAEYRTKLATQQDSKDLEKQVSDLSLEIQELWKKYGFY